MKIQYFKYINLFYRRNVNLTTEFYSTAKTEKLQLWVVLVSVSLGLIFLFIIIIMLSMVSFIFSCIIYCISYIFLILYLSKQRQSLNIVVADRFFQKENEGRVIRYEYDRGKYIQIISKFSMYFC